MARRVGPDTIHGVNVSIAWEPLVAAEVPSVPALLAAMAHGLEAALYDAHVSLALDDAGEEGGMVLDPQQRAAVWVGALRSAMRELPRPPSPAAAALWESCTAVTENEVAASCVVEPSHVLCARDDERSLLPLPSDEVAVVLGGAVTPTPPPPPTLPPAPVRCSDSLPPAAAVFAPAGGVGRTHASAAREVRPRPL